MLNESINFGKRIRPGDIGGGEPLKQIHEGVFIICAVSECSHVRCCYCRNVFTLSHWRSHTECPVCGK